MYDAARIHATVGIQGYKEWQERAEDNGGEQNDRNRSNE